MSTKKKLLQAAAGSAGGGAGLNVEEVFSTYLWDGTGGFGERTIANGIDLSGEGGFVWVKDRENSQSHGWYDTERGATKYLQSNTTDAEATVSLGVTSFKTNGFGVDYSHNNAEYASWTFRKAPKFFDVVTYTGAAYVDQTVSHNLGSVPGMIIIKCTSSARNWVVYHRSLGNTKHLHLNTTDAESTVNYFNNTDPTDTTFTVEGGDSDVNGYNETYVAYLFAHNDGDGEFGPDADQDIIKCGVYSGNDASQEIDVGFEPQWLMIKRITDTSDWIIYDSMRNWITSKNGSGDSSSLEPNTTDAEQAYTRIHPSANGFGFDSEAGSWANQSAHNYIYIAIRRGPMAVPTDATDVFAIDTRAGGTPSYISNFPVDMGWKRTVNAGSQTYVASRLTGTSFLATASTSAESSDTGFVFDYMNGWADDGLANSNVYSWMWKRAPSFCDVVAYTGNGTAGRTVSHNLGVAPEMMWIKCRSNTAIWPVYHKDLGGTKILRLHETNAEQAITAIFNNTNPTSEVFTVGNGGSVNNSGDTYIAYLFASLDGVSKVGSYTGTGAAQNIDCGFSNGARFILIKRTDSTGGWQIWDSERGIVTGNDPRLNLNDTSSPDSYDFVDPYSAGFSVTTDTAVNTSGASYIFYAIAQANQTHMKGSI